MAIHVPHSLHSFGVMIGFPIADFFLNLYSTVATRPTIRLLDSEAKDWQDLKKIIITNCISPFGTLHGHTCSTFLALLRSYDRFSDRRFLFKFIQHRRHSTYNKTIGFRGRRLTRSLKNNYNKLHLPLRGLYMAIHVPHSLHSFGVFIRLYWSVMRLLLVLSGQKSL